MADVAAGTAAGAWIVAGEGDAALSVSIVVASAPVWVVLAKLCGLYDREQRALRHLTLDEVPALVTWAATGTALVAFVAYVALPSSFGASTAVAAWLLAWLTACALRTTTRFAWRRLTPPSRGLIVGADAAALAIRRKVELFPDIHLRIDAHCATLAELDLDDPPEWLLRIDRVLVTAPAADDERFRRLVDFCRRRQLGLSALPPESATYRAATRINRLADMPLIEYQTWHVPRSTLFLKRALDIVVSAFALVVLAPVFVAVAAAVAIDSGSPVLFQQLRAGRDGRTFAMWKFRTMSVGAEEMLPRLISLDDLIEPMFKLQPDPRTTRMGRVLRRWSLDELPQLLSVFRGDMSLVGPRPEQIELVRRYGPDHEFRLAVKPGLTGPMQVYGRGDLSFAERLAVEQEYIEQLSLRRDLRILALTLSAVLGGRGAF